MGVGEGGACPALAVKISLNMPKIQIFQSLLKNKSLIVITVKANQEMVVVQQLFCHCNQKVFLSLYIDEDCGTKLIIYSKSLSSSDMIHCPNFHLSYQTDKIYSSLQSLEYFATTRLAIIFSRFVRCVALKLQILVIKYEIKITHLQQNKLKSMLRGHRCTKILQSYNYIFVLILDQ